MREIRDGWESKTLDDIAELQREQFLPSKNDIRPYIGLEHIGEGTLSLLSVGKSSEVTSGKLVFNEGDILFGKLRPYFRKVILATFNGVCSTDIFVIKPKGKTYNKYLFYLFASKDIVDSASRASEGTKMPRASWDFLKNVDVNVPPFEEQKKIGDILYSLDSKIALNRSMNSTLEAIGQALFRRWFVDFEFPNEEGKPYRSSGGEMVETELGEVPKGWRVKPFSEVIAVNPNRKLIKNTIAKKVGMADLNAWQSWIESWQLEEYKSGPRFQNGDTLFARITPSLEHGKTAFVSFLDKDEIAFGSTEFIIFAPKIIQSNFYIFHLDRSETVREVAIGAMTGSSGRQRVPDDLFEQLLIFVPSQQIIDTFHKAILPFFEEIAINANQNRNLVALRDALLPKLMSGEIRVFENRESKERGLA